MKPSIKERLDYLKICDEALKYYDISAKPYHSSEVYKDAEKNVEYHTYYAILRKEILFSLLNDEEFKNYANYLMKKN